MNVVHHGRSQLRLVLRHARSCRLRHARGRTHQLGPDAGDAKRFDSARDVAEGRVHVVDPLVAKERFVEFAAVLEV